MNKKQSTVIGSPLELLLNYPNKKFGTKALNLAILKKAGLPVPDGLLITNKLGEGDWGLVEGFIKKSSSMKFAVRSSGLGEDGVEHSFAGQFDSFLGCKDLNDVQLAVSKCFASQNSPHVKAYLDHNGIGKVELQVFVQQQIDSKYSGVFFSHDPRLEGSGPLLELVSGMGEALVSGRVTPQRIEGPNGKVPLLDAWDSKTRDLIFEYGKRAEAILGFPVDMEWALDKDMNFWILQARPITTNQNVDVLEQDLRDLESQFKSDTVFDGSTLADLGYLPSPLSISLWSQIYSKDGAYQEALRRIGKNENYKDGSLLKTVLGRPYVNMDDMESVLLGAIPYKVSLEPEPKLKFAWEKLNLKTVLNTPRSLAHLASMSIHMMSDRSDLMKNIKVKMGNWQKESIFADDFDAELDSDPYDEFMKLSKVVCNHLWIEPFQLAIMIETTLSNIKKILAKEFGEEKQGEILSELLSEHLETDTTKMIHQYEQAQNNPDLLSEFLRRYGYRGAGEMDLSNPRYKESKIDAIQRAKTDTKKSDGRVKEIFGSIHWTRKAYLEKEWDTLKDMMVLRESLKMQLLKPYARLRFLALAIGEMNKLGNDVFFLKIEELEEPKAIQEGLISVRKKARQQYQEISMPTAFELGNLREVLLSSDVDSDRLDGVAVSPGVVRGTAVVVEDPSKINWSDWPEDAILVSRNTDPGWTPVFENAKGLIVESGGILSHAGILARELGLPCVGQVDACVMKLKTGDKVYVDGSRGFVSTER